MSMELLRRGGHVVRYHTVETIGRQTVADHTWGLIVILFAVCRPTVDMLRYATFHDVPEYMTGDVVATAKWRSQSLRDALDEAEAHASKVMGIPNLPITNYELLMVKYADLLELLWYCYEQRRLGNRNVDEIWGNGGQWMLEHDMSDNPDFAKAVALHRELIGLWNNLFDSEPSSI